MMVLLASAAFAPLASSSPNSSSTEQSQLAAGQADKMTESLVDLFSTDDYPHEAIRAEQQGTTKVRFTVNDAGRVDQCQTVESSGSASLDEATCRIIKERARFKPERDSRVSKQRTTSVRWLLPLSPVSASYVRAIFALKPSSPPAECKVESDAKVKFDCSQLNRARDEFLAWPERPDADALVLEMGRTLGAGDSLRAIGDGPSQRLLKLEGFTVTVDATGKVVACEAPAIGTESPNFTKNCEQVSKSKFEPLAEDGATSPRVFTQYFATYLLGSAKLPKLTNLKSLFTPDDYPADALAQSKEGISVAELMIEADGRASSCRTITSAGMPSLDQASCRKMLAEGKFRPGLTPDGHAYRALVTQRVRWIMPVSPFRNQAMRALVTLGEDGAVQSCTIEGQAGQDISCEDVREQAAVILRDSPVPRRSRLIVESGDLIGQGDGVYGIGSGPGQSALAVAAATIEVDADGKVIGCKPALGKPHDDQTRWICAGSLVDKFPPLEQSATNRLSRHITRYYAVYFSN